MNPKKFGLFTGLTTLAALIAIPSSFAKTDYMKACKSDLKKFGCTAKSEMEAHECIQKHEKEGSKHEGLSSHCYKAHESYEKKAGIEEEKGEEHHK